MNKSPHMTGYQKDQIQAFNTFPEKYGRPLYQESLIFTKHFPISITFVSIICADNNYNTDDNA